METYVDNILVESEDWEEHLMTLTALFRESREQNFTLRPDKCEFGFREMDFLGYHLGHNMVCLSKENVQKLLSFPVPTTKKKLQRFLGLANFNDNRRFVKNYAHLTKPLTALLSKDVVFAWGHEQGAAFDKVKELLSSYP